MRLKQVVVVLALILSATAVRGQAPPIDGTWRGFAIPQDDFEQIPVAAVFKADGTSLTGYFFNPMDKDDAEGQTELQNGTIDGNRIAFNLLSTRDGISLFDVRYEGIATATEIRMTGMVEEVGIPVDIVLRKEDGDRLHKS